jgi:hypothetical protein
MSFVTIKTIDLDELTVQEVPADRVNAKYKIKESIQERFLAYHAANPEVYEKIVQLARSVVARGYKKIGIRSHLGASPLVRLYRSGERGSGGQIQVSQ